MAMTALFREPLLQFCIAGAILFGGYAWVHRGQEPAQSGAAIEISEGDVRWLVETWRRQWLREPGPAEVQGMIAGLIEESILAREAIEMGLERDDTIVRRRLAQKLTFLVEDTSRLVEPTEEELVTWHAAHQDRFRTDATVTFTQVFFNPSGRSDAEADARAAMVALREGHSGASDLGDRLLVEGEFRDLDQVAVASIFGPDFAVAVFSSAPGQWSGPIRSAYGEHLVHVSAATAGKPQPFEAVRGKVAADWWREREDAARRDYMALLRAKYPVSIDPAVQALIDGAPASVAAER